MGTSVLPTLRIDTDLLPWEWAREARPPKRALVDHVAIEMVHVGYSQRIRCQMLNCDDMTLLTTQATRTVPRPAAVLRRATTRRLIGAVSFALNPLRRGGGYGASSIRKLSPVKIGLSTKTGVYA
jgi:hypothetical protein